MILLKIARDIAWAIGDSLDLTIELLTPVKRSVQIHRFYEEANR